PRAAHGRAKVLTCMSPLGSPGSAPSAVLSARANGWACEPRRHGAVAIARDEPWPYRGPTGRPSGASPEGLKGKAPARLDLPSVALACMGEPAHRPITRSQRAWPTKVEPIGAPAWRI